MANFTKFYRLPVKGHQDIAFFDIDLVTDTPGYLDAERIECSEGVVAAQCRYLLNDFFSTLCEAASCHDEKWLYYLLSFGGEPNETRLGLSSYRPCGRGVTPEILMPIIRKMIDLKLFDRALVNCLNDLPLLTPNFGPDRCSDLITNICREPLHIFTRTQYHDWQIPYDQHQLSYRLPAWDADQHAWHPYRAVSFYSSSAPLLLVPHCFISKTPLCTPGELLNKYALVYRQDNHLAKKSPLCRSKLRKNGVTELLPPTKKSIRELELRDLRYKEFLLPEVIAHPKMLSAYHQDIADRISPLSVAELDHLAYGLRSSVV